MYGYKTKRLWVLKAEKEDIEAITKLYPDRTPKERKLVQVNWENIIEVSKEDYHKDVAYVIKDKCKKVIGILEAESDRHSIDVGIWIPNKAKQITYLQEVVDSFIEWCEEEGYSEIIEIKLLDINEGTYTVLKRNYNLIV